MSVPFERMDFSDMGKYSVSEAQLHPKEKDKSGCHVSTAVGFLLLLLAIAIAVGVGLIVHFAGDRGSVVCHCPTPSGNTGAQATMSPLQVREQCKKLVMEGDTDVCTACKDAPTSPLTTNRPMTTTPKPPLNVRLPMDLYPVHFDVEITPHIYSELPDDFTFDGKVQILLRCDKPTNVITFHSNRLVINNSSLELMAETVTAPSIVSWDWDKERQFMLIHLDGMLQKDGHYIVKMDYSSVIKDDFAGMYYSSYETSNGTSYLATTQFQPTDARKVFPCYGEPSVKSTFNITLVRQSHMVALSNMPVASSEDRGDNWVADVFEETPIMPVYLVAMIVSDFTHRSEMTKNNAEFRVWTMEGSLDQADFAMEFGKDVLTFYEDFFDIPYPLPKQDMFALPDFVASAMENWGLIVYRQSAMLYDPLVSTESDKRYVAEVIAHELSHQWFGNLVSPSWWDDLWLNEGFATFEAFVGVNQIHPEWKMWDQFILKLHKVFGIDGLVSSHPVYVPVGHPDEIYEIFDDISYLKGASIIRMMRFFLGDQTFQTGLSNYLKKKSYGAAFHDDLWQSLTEEATKAGMNINVKTVMDTWTLQMNYPVVMVTREGNDRIRVSQQRFLTDRNAVDPGKYTSDFRYKWEIPFTFTSSKDLNFHKTHSDVTWIHKSASTMDIVNSAVIPPTSDNTTWVLANPMQYGYYRVNYDEHNWMALIHQLNTDHTVIGSINRAQIINDAFNLAKAGMVELELALKTVEYLDKEMDYIPWESAKTELDFIRTMIARHGIFGKFKEFMRRKAEPVYKKLGTNNTGSSQMEIFARSTVSGIACEYGVQSCVDQSLKLYRQWMEDKDHNPISPDLKSTMYCAAIRYGGVAEWDFAYEQYKTATVAGETVILLKAMGCTRETWILSRYLDRALTEGEMRKQDALDVFVYVSGHPVGHSLAWGVFRDRWQHIVDEYSASFFAFIRVIQALTNTLNSQSDLAQLEQFMVLHPDQGVGARAFQQAVEKTKANVKWMEDNVHTVSEWLHSQVTDMEPTPSAPINVRLPMDLYPVHFDVEIKPYIYSGSPKDFYFDGKVHVLLRCDKSTKVITFHSNRLVINNSSLEVGAVNGTVQQPHVTSWEWDKERQFMLIHLDTTLEPGEHYFVKMNYTSVIKDDFAGMYYSSFKNGNETGYLATTQFQPTDARKVFPCYGEPSVKSTFNITLVRQSHMVALSNMPVASSEDRGDNWIADVFEETPIMPVYLVAMIVSDFTHRDVLTRNNISLRAWAQADSIDQSQFALDFGTAVLDFYEEFFDIPYPLPKQDMFALPDFVGAAMENWGLIVFRQDALLFEDGVSTERNKNFISEAVAHELSHQWFGNLVSPSWWDDLWLNEGFATFESYVGIDHVKPEWNIWDQFIINTHHAMGLDGLASSHPVYVPVGRPEEIYEIFDAISYLKGGSIIRMMQFFLGDQTFQKGLSNYLTKLSYGAAFHDDLWQSLSEQSALDGKNINSKEVMDTWTLQMNYPVVMVTRHDSKIMVTQQRFLNDPTAADTGKYESDFNYKWEIPFAFTTSLELEFNKTEADITWLRKDGQPVEIDTTDTLPALPDNTSWIVANPMMYGYYRVNYDENNWRALIDQLNTDHTVINHINRGQIINDAWNLAKSGMLSMDTAVRTVEYLDQERDYMPWKTAKTELLFLDSMIAKSGIYGSYKAFMRSKLSSVYNTLGLTGSVGDPQEKIFLRSEIANSACEYGIQGCIDESLRLYRQWMANPSVNPISPDLKTTVYCAAIRYGGVAEWDFAYEQYKTATVAGETLILLRGMGCTRETWILSRYLERALGGDIRKGDGLNVFNYVSIHPVGHSLAWAVFRDRWQHLKDEFSSSFFSFMRVIENLCARFNTQTELDQLEHFMATHPDLGVGTRTFQQGVEKSKANIQWMRNNYDTVTLWLHDLGY